MSLDWEIRRQAGVISLSQAADAGLSHQAVHRHVRTGRWRRLHPAVYLVAGHRLTAEARLRAAALWAGEDAVVSGSSAAWWHGMLADAPHAVHLTIPRTAKPRRQPEVLLRRRDLAGADVVTIRGVSTTALPLTVLEAATAEPDGAALLDRTLQRHVRFAELHRAHCRNLGRRGAPAAGRLLAAAADRAASAAERRLARLLTGAGIAGWELGYRLGPFHIDLAFPAVRLAVEVDGWAWHVDVSRFRRDRVRQNALVIAGWIVLRFTWHDLTTRPHEVVAEIRAMLSPRPPPPQ